MPLVFDRPYKYRRLKTCTTTSRNVLYYYYRYQYCRAMIPYEYYLNYTTSQKYLFPRLFDRGHPCAKTSNNTYCCKSQRWPRRPTKQQLLSLLWILDPLSCKWHTPLSWVSDILMYEYSVEGWSCCTYEEHLYSLVECIEAMESSISNPTRLWRKMEYCGII